MAISSEMISGGASRQGANRQGVRHGRAFLLEALSVLAFLMFSLAVFAQLFAGAELEALKASHLSEATLLAARYAEEFSADPASLPETAEEGDLQVTCEVRPSTTDAGTLYEATITVSDKGGEVYVLETARYVSDGGEVS